MRLDNLVVCADVGGSHITSCLLDLETRQLVKSSEVRLHIDSHAEADKIIADWSKCIAQSIGSHNVKKVCLAMPGPFDYEQGICLIQGLDKYPHLYNLNVKDLLGKSLGYSASDIYLNNDAACFLQGEVFSGSAKGYKTVIGVTLGTGLGTAVCRDGSAYSADLWSFPFKGTIAEEYISTRWFVKRYFELTGKEITGARELSTLIPNDQNASMIFEEFGHNLGSFLTAFMEKEQPEAIVIGGNIAKAYAFFGDTMENEIRKVNKDVMVTTAILGEDAMMIGAGGGWYMQLQQLVNS
ncbi:ROK family protein [Pinibacter aurantiacus]|uniref:ROK family protein n=1 Tax=Pinibacter aurantiacus TaxID=2851599 RepID=A0A9E2SB45_9BACT|nr:ROK family protein [Pinibacter aurantiacus]MBV4358213.1 ROK family protein [Pinibacter aurantiacus]